MVFVKAQLAALSADITKYMTQDRILTFADDSYFDELSTTEFGRLEEHGHTYLDYSGAALYSKSQLEHYFDMLERCALRNPYSGERTSYHAMIAMEEATKKAVLQFFEARDYQCVFTQSTEDSYGLLASVFPFEANSQLLMLGDQHHAYEELRSRCSEQGGDYAYARLDEDLTLEPSRMQILLKKGSGKPSSSRLFVYPAQSAVSGVRHPLNWVGTAQSEGWNVLLDADAYVGTAPLRLTTIRPDFVSFSFCKMFGYPTGIACLLIRNSTCQRLLVPAENTTADCSLLENHLVKHEITDFLAIPAVKTGLDFMGAIGLERIQNRIYTLSAFLYEELLMLRHRSGEPVVKIHGPEDPAKRGGTFLMNFCDAAGKQYDSHEIERAASAQNISISAGCFGHIGMDEILTAFSNESFDHADSIITYNELVRQYNQLRGAVRVSLGIATRRKDLETFVSFVSAYIDIVK